MRIWEIIGFGLRRAALMAADAAVTHPLFSWSWSASSESRFNPRLADFRPADIQTVSAMMDGKYLFAGRMVDTEGISPFAIETDIDDWFFDLHSFGWLRHFSGLDDPGKRAFARTLTMDWIGRFEGFDPDVWDVFVTARRVLNWLKAHALLLEGASPEQARALSRVLSAQIQSLKVRAPLTHDPLTRLMVAIALVGAALSEADESRDLSPLVARLQDLLEEHMDADGLTRTRNPHVQIQILTELIPVNRALGHRHGQLSGAIAPRIEAMHRALDALVLGTREPVQANGCGQVPVELVLAIEAQSGARAHGSGLVGGYGVLVDGPGKIVADGGAVPPLAFAGDAHAGALSFEYACGSTLICGNCGPAPGPLWESRNLFRHSSAHSAPTIDDISSARIGGGTLLGDGVRPRDPSPRMAFSPKDNGLEMTSSAYRRNYGLDVTRRLTLMGGGQTLVGQDRFSAARARTRHQGDFSIRFHLAPGIALDRGEAEDLIRLIHRNGEVWAFLWEGAQAGIEDSVRHSAVLGLARTRQIVLSGPARDGAEIAWVFTRQS